MASAAFPRIVRVPGVHGGEPIVEGTRVPVRSLVLAMDALGDEALVLSGYPQISRSDLLQALAYYDAHREEIDARIAEQEDDSADESEPELGWR